MVFGGAAPGPTPQRRPLRLPSTTARLRGLAQEGLQMLADDPMEHGVFGVTRSIHGLGTRHSPGYRACEDAPMPTDGYA